PCVWLSQELDFLTIAIHMLYARVSEFNVYFERPDFKFYAKLYFLRLTLPGKIVENGSHKGPMAQIKEFLPFAYMLAALLAPRKSRTARSLLEETGASEIPEEVDDEEFDWEIEQTPYGEVSESAMNPQCHYGFGNLQSGVFQWLQDQLSDVIDIKDPDFSPVAKPRQKCLATDLANFDPDHYLIDIFEDEAVEQILKYNLSGARNHASLVSFSEEEKYQLQKFVDDFKSYLLEKKTCCQVYYSLIDVLLEYCYETCVTEGEKNVESAWNIRKLSPTLWWFETWTNVHAIMVSFERRVLCYPLYCHFKLVMKAYRNTIKISQLGKMSLDIHKIFQENNTAYILNDLYISDYCVWIQKLAVLAEALKEVSLTKVQLGLELEELAAAALLVQEEAALKAAHSVSGQQALCSSSEASDVEESDSTVSSGNEDSDSDSKQVKLKDSPSKTVSSLQGPFVERSALLIVDGGVCRNIATQESDASQGKPLASSRRLGVSGPLTEECGEQLKTTVQVSEPKGTTAVTICRRDTCRTPVLQD
uniref:Protein SHQ1 homolog n=1 Tax=Cebus imitator TaxID=2715852 RepID=A0A2K5S7G1_CEBIM